MWIIPKKVRNWFWRRRVNKSLKVLDELDWNLRRQGYNKRQIKQFWRDFNKSQKTRIRTFLQMTQD